MKKRFLIFALAILAVVLVLAFTVNAEEVNAEEPDYIFRVDVTDLDATFTLKDGTTVVNMWDNDGDALVWYMDGEELKSVKAKDLTYVTANETYVTNNKLNTYTGTDSVTYYETTAAGYLDAVKLGDVVLENSGTHKIVVANFTTITSFKSLYSGSGKSTFKGNKILECIWFSEYFDVIATDNFNGCTSLSQVVAKHVKAIGSNAFRDCNDSSVIKHFDFGNGLVFVATEAFRNVKGLQYLNFGASFQWGDNDRMFQDCNDLIAVVVPGSYQGKVIGGILGYANKAVIFTGTEAQATALKAAQSNQNFSIVDIENFNGTKPGSSTLYYGLNTCDTFYGGVHDYVEGVCIDCGKTESGEVIVPAHESKDAPNVAQEANSTLKAADGTTAVEFRGGSGFARLFDGSLDDSNPIYLTGVTKYNVDVNVNGKFVDRVEVSTTTNGAFKPYSVYVSDDGENFELVEENIAGGTTTIYVFKAVKTVRVQFENFGTWNPSLNEVKVFACDTEGLVCDHANAVWTPVADSNTCFEYGKDQKDCPDCDRVVERKSATLAPLGHNFTNELTTPGSNALGVGKIKCSRCDTQIDCATDVDAITLLNKEGLESFVTLSASSTGGWGPTLANIADGKWDNAWMSYWYAAKDEEDSWFRFDFEKEVDLTKLDISLDNIDQVVKVYKIVGDAEIEVASVAVAKDSNLQGLEANDCPRITIEFKDLTVKAIKIRTTSRVDNEGHPEMVICEAHPYFTVKGAGKTEYTIAEALIPYTATTPEDPHWGDAAQLNDGIKDSAGGWYNSVTNGVAVENGKTIEFAFDKEYKFSSLTAYLWSNWSVFDVDFYKGDVKVGTVRWEGQDMSGNANVLDAGGVVADKAVLTAVNVKYNGDGNRLAEIEFAGASKPLTTDDAVVLSNAENTGLYKEDGTAGTCNGGHQPSQFVDGKHDGVYMNTGKSYLLVDLTKVNATGSYVTEVAVDHVGNAKYSLYYSVDGENFVALAEGVKVGGEISYPVFATVKAVKFVFDEAIAWNPSLKELTVKGIADPSKLACTHTFTEWAAVEGSATCTDYGYEARECTDCGKEFHRTSTAIVPTGHKYVTEVTAAGTSSAFGAGKITCSKCDLEIVFDEPVDLMTLGGAAKENLIQFTNASASTTGDWGPTVSSAFNGKWDNAWNSYWYSAKNDPDPYYQIDFGTAIDLTKVEISLDNIDQTLKFYSVVGDSEVLFCSVDIAKDTELQGLEANDCPRITVDFKDVTLSTLRIRTTPRDDGNGATEMVICEVAPYGTVKGAGKTNFTKAVESIGYTATTPEDPHWGDAAQLNDGIKDSAGGWYNSVTNGVAVENGKTIEFAFDKEYKFSSLTVYVWTNWSIFDVDFYKGDVKVGTVRWEGQDMSGNANVLDVGGLIADKAVLTAVNVKYNGDGNRLAEIEFAGAEKVVNIAGKADISSTASASAWQIDLPAMIDGDRNVGSAGDCKDGSYKVVLDYVEDYDFTKVIVVVTVASGDWPKVSFTDKTGTSHNPTVVLYNKAGEEVFNSGATTPVDGVIELDVNCKAAKIEVTTSSGWDLNKGIWEIEAYSTSANVHEHDFATLGAITYANGFDKAGSQVATCECGKESAVAVDPIFTVRGYSIKGTTAIAVDFDVNVAALEAYEAASGESLKYGVFAAGAARVEEAGKLFNDDGTTASDKFVKAEMGKEYARIGMQVAGFPTDFSLVDAKLVMGMYIEGNDGVVVIQAQTKVDTVLEYLTVSMRAVATALNGEGEYDDIVNAPQA